MTRGCGELAIGVATGSIVAGFGLLCLLVYGSGSDSFGMVSLPSLALVALGTLGLAVVAAGGWIHHARRRRIRRAAAITAVGAVAALAGAAGAGWIGLDIGRTTWWVAVVPVLLVVAATIAVTRGNRPSYWVATLLVVLTGGGFAWGIESSLDVSIIHAPEVVRRGDPAAVLIFTASESGTFEARIGSGCSGPVMVAGSYGPGWLETERRQELAVALAEAAIPAGETTITVCVRSGIAFGQDEVVIRSSGS